MRKRITKAGSITIPRVLREETGILPGVVVDVKEDEDGIHIKKRFLTCHFCGSVDEVKSIHKIEICKICAKKIVEGFNEKIHE